MLTWDKDRSYKCFTHGRKKKVVCQKAAYMCFYEISKRFRLSASKDSGTLRPSLYCIVLYWVLPLHVLCILPAGLSFDLS